MVPLVSSVSLAASVRYCSDIGACSALVSLVSICVSVKCFGESGACGATGAPGVRLCFSEILW